MGKRFAVGFDDASAAAGNALTIADVAGKIDVASSYVMDTNAKFMDLIFVNGVWTEMAR
jgi:hypothetical protein